MKTNGFTSLLESSYGKTTLSSVSLINGLRVKHNDSWYLVGQACKNMGRNPHRLVNASPDEIDYHVLLNAALLFCSKNSAERINLTLGFPYSTYNMYKGMAEKLLAKKAFMVEYDTAMYRKDGIIEKKLLEIDNFEVIPELVACVIALKKTFKVAEENFLIISLGFGTTEIGVVAAGGLNKRTIISVPGIMQCIKHLRDELEKENITGFMTDHQLDDSFVKGSVVLNRTTVNLTHIRTRILKSFYKEYISDTIRSIISDRDFERIEKIYVCGGGVHYQDLQDAFKAEFDKIVGVEFINEPDTLASIGYYHNSVRLTNGPSAIPVGIDLGNSSTYITTEDNEN